MIQSYSIIVLQSYTLIAYMFKVELIFSLLLYLKYFTTSSLFCLVYEFELTFYVFIIIGLYCYQLSNNQVHPNGHDEVDIEFLGTIPGRPYTLQTNIYVNSGDAGNGRIVTGREQQIHLWFDPTQDFHRYSILWTPYRIVFLVDNTPIRKYIRSSPSTFPTRPMWVYGSIWDASSWATENGKYKVDYRYEPFVAKYKDFVLIDCSDNKASACYGRG